MTRIDDQHRVGKYRKDQSIERQLTELNSLLSPVERELLTDTDGRDSQLIFIVGMARTGSTLLSQILASSGAFAYPTNFLARFWEAPLVGARIQDALQILKSESITFGSDYGVTSGWAGPHEFGYFWERFFTFVDYHVCSKADWERADLDLLRREVVSLLTYYDKPFFFKNMTCGLNIQLLSSVFPNARYIHVKRDPVYVAQSVYQARVKRLGDRTNWYSLRPAEYHTLKQYPVEEQIALQIRHVVGTIDEALGTLHPEHSIEIHYEDLCSDPEREIERALQLVYEESADIAWDRSKLTDSKRANNRIQIPEPQFDSLMDAVMRHSP